MCHGRFSSADFSYATMKELYCGCGDLRRGSHALCVCVCVCVFGGGGSNKPEISYIVRTSLHTVG